MKIYINNICNLIVKKCGVSNLSRVTFVTLLTLMTTLANADFSTGFESSEGFVVDSTFVGVDGWALYAGADRGKAWNDVVPGAKVGNQYAKVYGGSFNTTSIAGFNRQLDANERIGDGRANIWTTSASVWMAVANADAGNNFGGIYFSDFDGKDAAVAGFNGDKFAYFNGASMVSSTYICSANTWYLFEFTIKCNGTGVADTYDMTVRNSDGSEVFSVTDKYFRASGEVDYIDNIKIFSGRAPANVIGWPDIGTIYFDQIELPDIPPPPSGTLIVLQ